jgi:4-hydroxybenzoate polyprenyltransferase
MIKNNDIEHKRNTFNFILLLLSIELLIYTLNETNLVYRFIVLIYTIIIIYYSIHDPFKKQLKP